MYPISGWNCKAFCVVFQEIYAADKKITRPPVPLVPPNINSDRTPGIPGSYKNATRKENKYNRIENKCNSKREKCNPKKGKNYNPQREQMQSPKRGIRYSYECMPLFFAFFVLIGKSVCEDSDLVLIFSVVVIPPPIGCCGSTPNWLALLCIANFCWQTVFLDSFSEEEKLHSSAPIQ